MKQSITIFLLVFFLAIGKATAQEYKTGLGLRIGPFYGITLKHFMTEKKAVEAILMTRRRGVGVTGLYEIHTQAFRTPRLKAFGGIGAHINIFDDHKDSRFWDWDEDDNRGISVGDDYHMHIGFDMIVGLEYTLVDLPFNFGIDWKPALNIIGDQGMSTDQVAISLRFTF